jgi:hypothetical protein
MQSFYHLGSLIEKRWKGENYSEDVFPGIAVQSLHEADLVNIVSHLDIIHAFHVGTQFPEQKEDRFSDFPVTVYRGPRFRIDVYFWLDGTTSIHQHAFSGAFQLLLGSSIHSNYSFEHERQINSRFSIGRINLRHIELLEQGDVRKILPGRELIHSLFHLDRPSVTVTIRTHQIPSALPQYHYLKPYIASDPFFQEPALIKKMQSAMLLLRLENSEADLRIIELLLESDLQMTFSILNNIFRHVAAAANGADGRLLNQSVRLETFLAKARCRHGEMIDLIIPVLEELLRESKITGWRKYIKNNEFRFFLALTLNVPRRDKFLELVKQRFPESDPIDTICGWAAGISNLQNFEKRRPDILGIGDCNDIYWPVFRYLMEGYTVDQIVGLIVQKQSLGYSDSLQVTVKKVYDSLRHSLLFKPLIT